MKAKLAALMLSIGAIGLMLSPLTNFTSQAEARMVCKTKRGKGWAWTEDMARFQAWEIVAQLSGNWPFQVDTFKNERYKCRKDGSGYTCLSWIDVCKST